MSATHSLEAGAGHRRHRVRGTMYAVLLPPLIWFSFFILLPYIVMFLYSVMSKHGVTVGPPLTMASWVRLFTVPTYSRVVLKSAIIAAIVAVLAAIAAYPVAHHLALHARGRKQRALYVLAIIPLWASYLVRAYSWKVILGEQGIINSSLLNLGLIKQPISALLYSHFAIVLVLLHLFIPFSILSQFASMERIPHSLVEASGDLGGSRWVTFWRVILPLCVPGLVAGATISFSLSFGDFVAPILVGGPDGIMVANIIQTLYGASFDWPLGSALSILMLALAVVTMLISARVERKYETILG